VASHRHRPPGRHPLRHRQQSSGKETETGGIVVIALAVILAVVSFLLDSDREKVVKRTNALVQSVEARDWNRMATYLHPNVAVSVFAGRDQGGQRHAPGAEYSDLRQARVVSMDATVLPDQIIRVTMRVNGTTRDGLAFRTDWTLEWEETDGAWMVRNITPEGGPGNPRRHAGGFHSQSREVMPTTCASSIHSASCAPSDQIAARDGDESYLLKPPHRYLARRWIK